MTAMSLTRLRRTRVAALAALAGLALVSAGCAAAGSVPPSATSVGPANGPGDTPAAEQYCTGKGGTLVDRVATWNTNQDPSAQLQLAGRWRLCEFQMPSGSATTRISVDLLTLSSPEPTLASVAYLSGVKTSSAPQVSANPADWSCRNDYLGASSWGNTATTGGWVDAAQPTFKVMTMCVFPDGSAIDEFGLWYHANGVIRGADLAPLFAYQPGARLPAIFSSGR
jgi:putative hemolysin